MVDQLYRSTDLDEDGRQLVLNNNVTSVFYYDCSSESWDREGSSEQSWYLEKYLPNDSFTSADFLEDHWIVIDTPEVSDSTRNQAGGKANFGVENDEGIVGLKSTTLWSLSGDFEIRLYIDWSSYYNEYRSITHSFLKVGKDSENAVRISFCFDGEGYRFSSEKAVGRNLTFFDWQENGDPEVVEFSDAEEILYFKITRESGVVKTFICTDSEDTQVGDAVDAAIFSEDLFVELGVESKEYNTYRHSFTKFFVSGTVTPTTVFYSANRGNTQEFPERSMLVVDGASLSIIDFDTKKLWMRFLIGDDNAIPEGEIKARACNGTVYVTTSAGLLAFDFHRDKIFKYVGSTIKVALDPIVLRNSVQIYKNYATSAGPLLSDSINDVACKEISGRTFLAMATDSGVSVKTALASGIYNSTNGELPVNLVGFSDEGSLYWAGYDSSDNTSSLSYRTGISTFTLSGTNTFLRTDYYSTSTALPYFGEYIQSFDVRRVNDKDLIAVGTSEGLTYIGFTPDSLAMKSTTYSVESAPENPIIDPSFEEYLGINWGVYYNGLHKKFVATRETSFTGEGTYSLRLKFNERTVNSYFVGGTYGGVYQDVDLTEVNTLYYDIKIVGNEQSNAWNFQIVVDDTVVKEYRDNEGPFTKRTDSADVRGYTGVHRLWFRIYVPADHSFSNIEEREVYVDNLRTHIGDPDYRILPAGNASIKEVLLQFDSQGHKIYFAAPEGFGAVDLDNNSIDYFTEMESITPDTEILSGDFTRADE